MNLPKKKAKEFVRKYKLTKSTLTCDNMQDILKRQGFLLFKHNKYGRSSDKVEAILKSLDLTEYAEGKDGFVYVSSTDKAIFVNNQLGEDEELYILLHEQGHISCNHPVQHGVVAYNDVLCEQEANAFAYYVMKYIETQFTTRLLYTFCALSAAIIIGVAVYTCISTPSSTSLEATSGSVSTPLNTEVSSAIVFVAKTGTVYHQEHCHYIEGRSGVREMTIKSADALGLPPCSHCRPDLVE